MSVHVRRSMALGACALFVLVSTMGLGAGVAEASDSPGLAPVNASTSAATKYLAPAPRPAISGAPYSGELLTASTGTWGPAPVALSYQWYANGVIMDGETGSTLRVVVDYAFSRITVVVTGTKAGYQTLSRTSNPTAVIQIGHNPFTSAPKPVISGTGLVGSRLTANTGAWAPGPVTFAYLWWRNGVRIPDATGRTYIVTASDSGALITVTATGSSPGFASQSTTSAGLRLPS